MHAEVKIRRLPPIFDWVCELSLLDTIIAIAPTMPSSKPISFTLVNLSIPTTTDNISTISGVVVLIIEPSIGDVCESPNIIHNLRPKPINIAAPNIFRRSAGSTLSLFSHSSGIKDHSAATTSEAATIAKGEM